MSTEKREADVVNLEDHRPDPPNWPEFGSDLSYDLLGFLSSYAPEFRKVRMMKNRDYLLECSQALAPALVFVVAHCYSSAVERREKMKQIADSLCATMDGLAKRMP